MGSHGSFQRSHPSQETQHHVKVMTAGDSCKETTDNHHPLQYSAGMAFQHLADGK
jgi:hypothetical protein